MSTALTPLFHYLPAWTASLLEGLSPSRQQTVTELRLRAGQPVLVGMKSGFFRLCGTPLSAGELENTLLRFCDYSLSSCQDFLRRGFLPLPGGHRVGVCGQALCEGVSRLSQITSLNLRVAHSVTGLAKPVLAPFWPWSAVPSLLIAGAPGSGKTTLIRDLARCLSAGEIAPSVPVAVMDPRGELSGCRDFLGENADVFSSVPKTVAMEMALRTMSPRVMVCDEIGSEEETPLLGQYFQSGVSVIASAHADSLSRLLARPVLGDLLREGCFAAVVFLSCDNPGVPWKIVPAREVRACRLC